MMQEGHPDLVNEQQLRGHIRLVDGGRISIGLNGHVPNRHLSKECTFIIYSKKLTNITITHSLLGWVGTCDTWSSSPASAMTEGSDGCHSTDVIGPLCH